MVSIPLFSIHTDQLGISMAKDLSTFVLDLSAYKQIKRCGQGAFSSVYKYEQLTDKTCIAVKKIDKDVDTPPTQMMCLRELSILLSLQHPAVLRFVGFSLPEARGRPFCIATDFMSRGNLQELEKYEEQGKLIPGYDATGKSIIMYGVAAGMAHIHEHLVCHRDLKADNVFLDDHYEPKIADFGLSKITSDNFKMSAMVGTPFYMAPELFNPEGESTYAIDVYAYGMLLASIVTKGRFDFGRQRIASIKDLMNAVMAGKRCELPATIAPKIKELITNCWDGNPTSRPTFQAIVETLDASEDICFPGTDPAKYADYRRRIREWKPAVAENVEVVEEQTEAFAFD
jgi:serine/threonine protein kinase